MRETELKIMFPTEKLDALRFFMGKKELTVEQELKDYLDKTYEKVVPAHVREYVESRLDQVSPQEETPDRELRSSSRSHKGNASQDKPAASVSRR